MSRQIEATSLKFVWFYFSHKMTTHRLNPGPGTHPLNTPRTALFGAVLLCLGAGVAAQQTPATAGAPQVSGVLQPVVISGGASASERWRGVTSLDVLDGTELRDAQAQINLSEGLGRVPGLVLRNRQNYAQDLQLSIRGYGARASFGVRGVRLFVDGIPASAPDGQGQTAGFPIGSADRVEVVRGPFSALYGASAGGALLMYTQDGTRPTEWRAGAVVGPDGLWRLSTQLRGQTGAPQDASDPGWSYALDLGSFGTGGNRPQSAAERDNMNLRLSRAHEGGRTVLVYNGLKGEAQDPMGLDRSEFNANPRQTTPSALQYNTRKSTSQNQLGAAWNQALGGGHSLELMGYVGQRSVQQFQSIPRATELAQPGNAGGVIDLDRQYWGWNARWRLERAYDSGRLSMSAGVAGDQQSDLRRGYENFIGSTLGVAGKLRRDETNRAQSLDPYAQAQWQTGAWTLSGAVRRTHTELSSQDRYIGPGNGDDSGSTRYSATLPMVGARVELRPDLQAFASAGRGLETPTLNEVAYQNGASGFNARLNAARSRSAEGGLRGRLPNGWWTATLFDIQTQDEIVVQTNTAGRATYQNAGRTHRQGLELSGEHSWATVSLNGAYTWMDARYRDSFLTCEGSPAVCNRQVPAGSLMPGLPRQQWFAQLNWTPGWAGSVWSLEARHVGSVAVNDRNTDSATGYTLFNAAVRFEQPHGAWTLREFVRVDNLANRRYAGSVIVNEGNGRFFEPGAGRSVFAGVEVVRQFH